MTERIIRCSVLGAIVGLCVGAASCFAQGDYAQIGNLNYRNSPTDLDNWAQANNCCSIMQMQRWLREGIDVPLSARYLVTKAASESPTDQIRFFHGFTSAWLAVRLDADYGSCPASMYPLTQWRITPAMEAEAAKVKGRYDFLTLTGAPTPPAVPDYAAALVHLKANPGDAVLLSQYGFDGYAIVGVDADGKGIWIRHYKQRGKPQILHLDEAAGKPLWDKMIYDNPPQYQPVEFMTVHRMRW